MTEMTIETTVDLPYEQAVPRVRAALAEAGFGVLTEIDLAATLRAKLAVETPPRLVLGACRPHLAHRALDADPRVAAMLPCNVVVAYEDEESSRIMVFDPDAMTAFSDAPGLVDVAREARERLAGVLAAVSAENEGERHATGA